MTKRKRPNSKSDSAKRTSQATAKNTITEKLSVDLIQNIMDFLSTPDLARSEPTCKIFKHSSDSHHLRNEMPLQWCHGQATGSKEKLKDFLNECKHITAQYPVELINIFGSVKAFASLPVFGHMIPSVVGYSQYTISPTNLKGHKIMRGKDSNNRPYLLCCVKENTRAEVSETDPQPPLDVLVIYVNEENMGKRLYLRSSIHELYSETRRGFIGNQTIDFCGVRDCVRKLVNNQLCQIDHSNPIQLTDQTEFDLEIAESRTRRLT